MAACDVDGGYYADDFVTPEDDGVNDNGTR